jgi:streptogramin lyase
MRRAVHALRTALCFAQCAMFASMAAASERDSRDWKIHCSMPQSVTVDASGRIFATAMTSNQILAYDPATAALDRWRLERGALPRTLALAASGTIYFAAIGGAIGALEPSSGRVQLFAMPAPSTPYWVATARSGEVWFSDPGAMRLAALDPSTGEVQAFPVPVEPHAIAVDARGRVWVTLPESGELGVLDPRIGTLYRIRLGSSTRPGGIAATQEGIWVILDGPGTLLRLEGPRARDVTEYRPPPRFGPPVGLATDREGALWVTFRDTADLWQIGPSGTPRTVQRTAQASGDDSYHESAGIRSCAVAGGLY